MIANFFSLPSMILGLTLGVFLYRQSTESVIGLFLGILFWLAAEILCAAKAQADKKPTDFEIKVVAMEKDMEEMRKVMRDNAEFCAKEFSTLKNVLQIKQMGR